MVSDRHTVDMKTDDNSNTATVWTVNSDLTQLTHDVNSEFIFNKKLNLKYFRNAYLLSVTIMLHQYYHIWTHLRRVSPVT